MRRFVAKRFLHSHYVVNCIIIYDMNAYCQQATRVKGINFAFFFFCFVSSNLRRSYRTTLHFNFVLFAFVSGMHCNVFLAFIQIIMIIIYL